MEKNRILIVDDEPDIADTLSIVLRQLGYETSTAEHGAAALARLRGGFDATVVLLDLMMPVMDGETFLREQRHDPDLSRIPVVLLSGDHVRLAAATGPSVVARLAKPIELTDLFDAIQREGPRGPMAARQ
jgi:CheY-like chemotaxis protein